MEYGCGRIECAIRMCPTHTQVVQGNAQEVYLEAASLGMGSTLHKE